MLTVKYIRVRDFKNVKIYEYKNILLEGAIMRNSYAFISKKTPISVWDLF